MEKVINSMAGSGIWQDIYCMTKVSEVLPTSAIPTIFHSQPWNDNVD